MPIRCTDVASTVACVASSLCVARTLAERACFLSLETSAVVIVVL
jgi:hypothetical protein